MITEQKSPRIYVSHSIRGIKGINATDEDMIVNNAKAISLGEHLRKHFKSLGFYVPGDGDEFVMIAYRSKFLTENEILSVDCQIIDTCDAVLAFIHDQHVSGGMLVEILHAHETGKPVFLAKNRLQAERVLGRFLEGKMT